MNAPSWAEQLAVAQNSITWALYIILPFIFVAAILGTICIFKSSKNEYVGEGLALSCGAFSILSGIGLVGLMIQLFAISNIRVHMRFNTPPNASSVILYGPAAPLNTP